FTLITIIFTCIYAYYFKIIVDIYDTMGRLNLLTLTIIFIFILFIKSIIEYLRNNMLMYLNQKIDLSIITTTIKNIIKLPYSYYKRKTTGEMITRINDLMYVKNIISKLIITIFLDMLLSLVVLFILMSISIKMTLMLLIIAIIYLLVFMIYRHHTERLTEDIQERSAKTNSLLVESLTGYASIKGLNLEDNFIHKINGSYLDLTYDNLCLIKINNISSFIKNLMEGIFIILVIYLGINLVMDNAMTLGSLLTYYTLLFYFLNPIRNALDFYKEYYYTKSSIHRIDSMMEYKYDKLDDSSNLPFANDIHIKNLTFSYDNRRDILKNITLDIQEGRKVLLLGASGSGKSTLLKLIYRYYDVLRNEIFLGKYDLLDYKLSDIRRNISYLSQDEFLYTDTIKNNIILDRRITDKEFLDICKLTYVDEIVKDNPLGYDMPLEENGINISGGQRQRIILARTLLKETKIILIDEGMNEIDTGLERNILMNIFKYYPDKTFIIISHRTSNLDLFDKVIVLSKGSVGKDIDTHV
ncbi:MAG: ATP-binding cassette domain-containing protein, partial [Bacilli bacterium]|nr:ATP-binding cassette domain-containing protein [Bacilli bacterium]